MAFDGEKFGAEIVEAVRGHVERATAPLHSKIAELEGRPDAASVQRMIDEALAKAILAREEPPAQTIDVEALEARWSEQIERLEAGQSRIKIFAEALDALQGIDVDAMTAEIAEQAKAAAEIAAKDAVAAFPAPKDGEDGIDAPEVTADQIDASVARYFEANPVPTPKDGKDAEPITEAQLNEAIHRHVQANPIRDGKDGIGLAGALIDREGQLIVTLTNGEQRALGCVVGRDGIDAKGEPGRDALTLEAFDTELSENGRILTLSLDDGQTRVTHELQLPTMIYQGVYKEGTTYVQGDTVTWAGSLWHCNAETMSKPDDGGSWTLAAKRGSPGKDAGK